MPKPTIQPDLKATENLGSERRTSKSADTEAMAKLAYELWLQRGSPEGSPEEDWYQAERLLQSGAAAGVAVARAKS